MKFSTVIVSAFAAVATAAPTTKRGSGLDFSGLAGLQGFGGVQGFGALDFNYLGNINNLDINLLAALGQQQNFNIAGQFGNLFNNQGVFDIASLLEFQQLSTLLALQGQGVFGGFDLGTLALGNLNLGLLGNIGGLGLNQFVDQSFAPQIAQIASQTFGDSDDFASGINNLACANVVKN